VGKALALSPTLKPFEALKGSIQIVGGLDQAPANPGPDGAGDHARAGGTWLTSVRVRRTAGVDIHAGTSIDQVVAQQIGHLTRFPSLELTCDSARRSGNCDAGYSCAYQYNMAWRSPTTPLSPEPNPRLAFERLFGAGKPGERRASLLARRARQRSILDLVTEDAAAVQREVDGRDAQKLDEYLTGMREIEGRIERAERLGLPADPEMQTPAGIPSSHDEYLRLMFEVLRLAFQTDSTRVATFLLANEGNNRAFPEIGIAEGHHHLSHHQNKQEMIDKVAQIDLFYARQVAQFLDGLARAKDADGHSVLHNSMIFFGSAHSDGNRHSHVNLPTVLAGHGGGALKAGRFVQHRDQPMANLFLTLADRMGVRGVERFGDSTGRLADV
jgi:hypothetical protein